MKKYTKYLQYVLKHKWYVMIECFKKGQVWRGVMHDMSKFRPSEFIPYARYFYGEYKSIQEFNGDVRNRYLSAGCYKEKVEEDFNLAWLKHIHRNKHHWQYWLLQEDDGGLKKLEMKGSYIDEMISDWNGAGMAINGVNNTREWYLKNKENIKLNKFTRHIVETCLNCCLINPLK